MYLDFVEGVRGARASVPGGVPPAGLSTPALNEMASTIARESRSIPPGVPPIAWLHTSLGVRLSKSGDLAEADEHFRQALKWAPGYSIAAYDRSLLLLKLGRPAEALHDYLWAEARSVPKLPPANRRAFLDIFAREAAARGDTRLAAAAAEHSTNTSR
jgi:tetratricopeptide (TPR) repeat protein